MDHPDFLFFLNLSWKQILVREKSLLWSFWSQPKSQIFAELVKIVFFENFNKEISSRKKKYFCQFQKKKTSESNFKVEAIFVQKVDFLKKFYFSENKFLNFFWQKHFDSDENWSKSFIFPDIFPIFIGKDTIC